MVDNIKIYEILEKQIEVYVSDGNIPSIKCLSLTYNIDPLNILVNFFEEVEVLFYPEKYRIFVSNDYRLNYKIPRHNGTWNIKVYATDGTYLYGETNSKRVRINIDNFRMG